MSDRQKSTVSTTPTAEPEWERHSTFRHTFLAHLSPDLAEAVEQLGRGLYYFILALPGEPHHGSWTAARLRATVADLRFHANHLAALAQERHAASLSRSDTLLSERAEAWAVQAETLATRIEGPLSQE